MGSPFRFRSGHCPQFAVLKSSVRASQLRESSAARERGARRELTNYRLCGAQLCDALCHRDARCKFVYCDCVVWHCGAFEANANRSLSLASVWTSKRERDEAQHSLKAKLQDFARTLLGAAHGSQRRRTRGLCSPRTINKHSAECVQ